MDRLDRARFYGLLHRNSFREQLGVSDFRLWGGDYFGSTVSCGLIDVDPQGQQSCRCQRRYPCVKGTRPLTHTAIYRAAL